VLCNFACSFECPLLLKERRTHIVPREVPEVVLRNVCFGEPLEH